MAETAVDKQQNAMAEKVEPCMCSWKRKKVHAKQELKLALFGVSFSSDCGGEKNYNVHQLSSWIPIYAEAAHKTNNSR